MHPLRSPAVFVAQILCVSSLLSQMTYMVVKPDTIQQRVNQYKGNDTTREASLHRLFTEAGCKPANLSEQAVPGRKQPNLICILPGATAKTILIGAHFDHVDDGDGIVDNWSGAALLPSIYQSLATTPRQHTFIFVGFAGEEDGLQGSAFYLKQLPKEQLANIEAMINLDTLGLGTTRVWVSQSDPRLINGLNLLALSMKIPLEGQNLNGYGVSDEESFIREKVCTLTIHSLTPQTVNVLHHPSDNPSALRFHDYYDSYRLTTAYMAILDKEMTPDVCTAQPLDWSTGRRRHLRILRPLGPRHGSGD